MNGHTESQLPRPARSIRSLIEEGDSALQRD